jgi:hypothetical protein
MTPPDAVDEPPSLVELQARVEALLPEVEIADLPLEVHTWTGFLEYTHISGAPSRIGGAGGVAVGAARLGVLQRRAHARRQRLLPAADA